MVINLIYSRVSKEKETLQDLYIQETKLIEKFGIENPRILRERGSAYKIKNISKRKEFLKICSFIFNAKNTTIEDLILNNLKKKKVRLYVWDSHRLMRNIRYSLLFLILCDLYEIDLYTYKDGKIKEEGDNTPIKKMLRYMLYTVHAFSGEDYSYTTSENIKKSFVTKGNFRYSKDGKKIGKKFRDINGNKLDMPYERLLKLNKRIKELNKYYKRYYQKGYYQKIIDKIAKEKNIKISRTYVVNLIRKG